MLLCCLLLCHWILPDALSQQASVLSKGDWYKIGVTTTGVYKIDAEYLSKLGVDLNLIQKQHIGLFSNGAGVLPQSNSIARPHDLQQVAIRIDTRTDGRPEAIYFFGEGPTVITYDPTSNRFSHEINPYTDTTYYFLSFQEDANLSITQPPQTPFTSPSITNTFDHYWFYEKEATSLLKSGRSWWGDYLGTTPSLNFEIPFTGLVPGSNAKLNFSAIASAQVATKFVWQLDGTQIGEQPAGTVSTFRYDLKAQNATGHYTFSLGSNTPDKLRLNLSFDKNGQSSATGYLDYVSLQVKRSLRQYDEQTIYRFAPDPTPGRTFSFSGYNKDFILWDVTNPLRPTVVTPPPAETSQPWIVPVSTSEAKTLVGFDKKQVLLPASGKKLQNQNIRASDVPDLIILTAPEWKNEALQLASFRTEHDGLEVLTITTEQVYNEFASGKQDVSAIRDLCKYFYDREPKKLKYLLLFGDATFDFRNKREIDTPAQRASWVPTYQSRESLHPVYTFASDDYFGLLDAQSGYWDEKPEGDHLLQIGVGRLPVKTKEEAQVVVNKLVEYTSNSVMGKWKNRITFVADNGDNNIHQQHADQLAVRVSGDYLASRVFIDEYPLTPTSLGNLSPPVNKEIHRKINEGTLILNFTGHGDESGWTDEKILSVSDIQSLRGYRNMPLLVTATCEFGRYDDPSVVSGAELMVLSPRGAAIGAMTTTRPVFSSTNFAINSAFYEALTSSTHSRLGDIIRITKNNSLAGALNRNFVLIGDPSMKLARPDRSINIETLSEPVKPLEKTNITGSISDPVTGNADTTFNGIAFVSVYDKATAFKTLGANAPPSSYDEYRTRLFEGKATVSEGKFNIEMILPNEGLEDIRMGMISVYAHTHDELSDASGQSTLTIAPPSQTLADDVPPVITSYLNDVAFQDGQTVSPNPVLKINLSDNTGLKISNSGISCGMSAIIDDTLALPLSDYFSFLTDSHKEAEIIMPLNIETEGLHTLKLRFCDLNGNSTEKTMQFNIKKEPSLSIRSAILYPNPFRDKVSFRLSHNRAGQDLEIQFRLYSKTGRLVFSDQFIRYNAEETLEYSMIPFHNVPGINPELQIYLYDVTLRSLQDMTTGRISGKLLQQ